jgi:hypothetical protein
MRAERRAVRIVVALPLKYNKAQAKVLRLQQAVLGEAMMRLTRRLTAMILVPACVGVLGWAVWPRSAPAPPWMDDYDVLSRPPESILPGTVIGATAPAGWSHLVIKSLPRVRESEIKNIPRNPLVDRSRSAAMASWMFTAFVADIRPEPHEGTAYHRIRSIALGLGTASSGRDIIITPETASEHGVELDGFTRDILTEGYKTQRRSRVVIQGATMAVVDTPVAYRFDGRNRLARFRYALLVDGPSGRLNSVVWLLDAEGRCGETASILAPNTIDEAELIPDPGEFNVLGIPSETAFAVDRLPPGRARVLLPPDLRPLAEQVKFSPAEAGSLEQRLRQVLAQHP